MKALLERLQGGAWLVRIDGEADFETAPALELELQGALAEPCPRLLLDLSGLTYVSSAGLRVLLRARQRATDGGGWLRLFGLQHGVLAVLEQAELDHILAIFSSREEAESAPEKGP